MPDFYWIFGPNGSGKSTIVESITNLEHINVDFILLGLIEKSYPGIIAKLKENPSEWWIQDTYLTELENNLDKAKDIAKARIHKLIDAYLSFSVESNFLPASNEEFFLKAIEKKYNIHFIYLVMPSIEACIERVNKRTAITGQYVTPNGIRERFKKGLQDINNLLAQTSDIDYVEHISNIYILSAESDTEPIDIAHVYKGDILRADVNKVNEYSLLIPSLKQLIFK